MLRYLARTVVLTTSSTFSARFCTVKVTLPDKIFLSKLTFRFNLMCDTMACSKKLKQAYTIVELVQ